MRWCQAAAALAPPRTRCPSSLKGGQQLVAPDLSAHCPGVRSLQAEQGSVLDASRARLAPLQPLELDFGLSESWFPRDNRVLLCPWPSRLRVHGMRSSGPEHTSTSSAITRECPLVQSIQGPNGTVTLHLKESPQLWEPLQVPLPATLPSSETSDKTRGLSFCPFKTLRVAAAPLLEPLGASQCRRHL